MPTNGDRPGAHPPNEQYLEAIFNLEEEGNQVIQARLAERVGHSAPTVSEMVHRLKEAGYLDVHGRNLTLTSEGRSMATSVIRKHRLAERLLTDIIGLPWHKVHAEADRWEHVISDEVEAHLVSLLDDPATCPHGNPIPGASAPAPPLDGVVPLSNVAAGTTVRLTRVTEEVEIDTPALCLLGESGLVTGALARVVSCGPDGAMRVVPGATAGDSSTMPAAVAAIVEIPARICPHLYVVPVAGAEPF